jgi:site-specific recombinase XerD
VSTPAPGTSPPGTSARVAEASGTAAAVTDVAHLDSYLAHLAVERGLSDNTLAAYRRDLEVYARYLAEIGITDPDEVADEDLEAYVAWLRGRTSSRGRPYAQSSLARLIVAVRGYHRFLLHDQLVSNDPSASLGTPRTSRPLPKALSIAEVERLLAAPVGATPLARRDRAMLELLYGAGLRISELVGLDVDDLDPVERLVRVHGKGDAERLVPYGDLAADALDAWLVQGRPSLGVRGPAVFVNARGGRLTRALEVPVLIARKRDGGELTADELDAFFGAYLAGEVEEAQVAALLMAGVIRGFTDDEAVALTEVLVRSGETVDLSALRGPTVDKHSTGGVGDTTTLIVAPLLAAAGAQLAKLSGRGPRAHRGHARQAGGDPRVPRRPDRRRGRRPGVGHRAGRRGGDRGPRAARQEALRPA